MQTESQICASRGPTTPILRPAQLLFAPSLSVLSWSHLLYFPNMNHARAFITLYTHRAYPIDELIC